MPSLVGLGVRSLPGDESVEFFVCLSVTLTNDRDYVHDFALEALE